MESDLVSEDQFRLVESALVLALELVEPSEMEWEKGSGQVLEQA